MLALFWVTTLVVYLPAISAGYIWDDDDYVTHNPTLETWSGLVDIWTDPQATPQYYPLVHSSYWIEYRLWGLNPTGYHLVNILLHGFNAFLLFLILRSLGMPWAWLAAMLYAVHPLNVESVAWITERKNVLAVLFFGLTTLAWMKFLPIDRATDENHKTPETGSPRSLFYGLAMLVFVGGLLSKTGVCMWPVAILLLYWGARHRWRVREVATLVPFFVVGAGMGLLTAYLERTHVGAEGLDWNFSIIEKFMIAGRVFWFYLGKTLLPYPLVFFYPRWEISASHWGALSWFIAAVLLVALLFAFRSRLSRWPVAAVLIYAATLFPAMGFFAVYPMRYSFVADHFAYIPYLALLSLIAGMIWQIPHETLRKGIAAACLLALAVMTFQRCRVYENEEYLWLDTLAKNPASCAAHNNLGVIYLDRGITQQDPAMLAKAKELFEVVTNCRMDQYRGYYHLGLVERRLGHFAEAESQFRHALKLHPDYPQATFNLGLVLNQQGKTEEALAEFHRIDHPDLLHNARQQAGVIAFGRKEYQAAEKDFKIAIQVKPDSLESLVNLATTQSELGEYDSARTNLLRAQALDPYNPEITRRLSQLPR